ncbi:MAG: quinone-dependent dihydroorotate dehydrogenase [Candidatus Poseidoniaceae archaeon]
MGRIFRLISRPLLAVQDSEKAHARSLFLLRVLSSNPFTRFMLRTLYKPNRGLPITRFGINFQHPFGIAAGMDKRAEALRGWESIGLGFSEIGGVTMLEQQGNPKPRMFRNGKDRALVNRMGFNNPGSEKVALRLKKSRKFVRTIPVWANLGKSKLTPLSDAKDDYATTMRRLWRDIDVFVINVSSPNTPGLRDLQHGDYLTSIIQECISENSKSADLYGEKPKPILIKIAPDLTFKELEQILDVALDEQIDGIVATNTTLERPNDVDKTYKESGGCSGAPLKVRSTEMIHHIFKYTNGELPIVGVGGIMSSEDAWEKIINGASLLQAYAGFVFEGPGLTKEIVNGLRKKLQNSEYESLEDAIGSSVNLE